MVGNLNPTEAEPYRIRTCYRTPRKYIPILLYQNLPGTDHKARTQPRRYTTLSRYAPHPENMSAENPVVAPVALDQGTLNFAQAVESWDGQGAAPFSTAQIRDLASLLCN